uniref:Uncharacterized protein n=1 Tax=Nelumbo nucifera TaxID=4432 RepID=A0A822YPG6_NELNU|nr:TPA_asm: hypothetical protein HUJ06_011756 [Nelumbo nucifera]
MASVYAAEGIVMTPEGCSSATFSKHPEGLEGAADRSCVFVSVNVDVSVSEGENGSEKDIWNKESCTTPTAAECRIPESVRLVPSDLIWVRLRVKAKHETEGLRTSAKNDSLASEIRVFPLHSNHGRRCTLSRVSPLKHVRFRLLTS